MAHSMTLVVFTFLSQLAIGAFVAFFFLDTLKKAVSKKTSFIALMTILAVSVVAVIVSVFHLGHPLNAYRAILNFGQSWLTREIVFFPAFILFVCMYAFFAKTESMKKTIGWISVVLGIITIFCTAMIYTIPAMPAWDNATTTIAFYVTALLAGPVLIQVLVSVLDGKFVDFTFFTLGAAIFAIGLNVVNLTIMNGSFPAAVETASLLMSSPLFWVKMVLLMIGLVISVVLVVNKKCKTVTFASVILVCFVVAEFIGRMLFYSTGVHL